jgi:tetratricopeptide (TPR) repeat protein
LVLALSQWWYLRGHLREGRGHLEALLEPQSELSPAMQGALLYEAAVFAHRTGHYAEAASLANRLLEQAQDANDLPAIAQAFLATALMAQTLGDEDRAARDLDASIEAARAAGADRILAMAHGNRGDMEMLRANYTDARHHFEEARALFEKLGDQRSVSLTVANLGLLFVREGRDRDASRLLEQALCEARRLDDKECVLWCLPGVAAIAARTGKEEDASRLLGVATRLREETGHAPQQDQRELEEETIARLRAALGTPRLELNLEAGRRETADQGVEHALALASSIGRRPT